MRGLQDIRLTPDDRAAIERASRVLREQFPVDRIILFGSKARGDDQPDSDIDLLVLTREDLDWGRRIAISHAMSDLQMELGAMVSPVVFAADEWEHGVSQALPLHDEVDRDGVLV